MWAYVVRRILLAIPTILGIVVLTFALFTLVAKDPAAWCGARFPTFLIWLVRRNPSGHHGPAD